MGVNTPASSVIIAGLEHPGEQPYSVAEYKNLVGRAGRLGYAEQGTSYLLALDPRTEHDFWVRYVCGSPEDLVSRFLDADTDPRSLIVRVLVAARRAAGEGVTQDEIVDFLEASFGAFQAMNRREGWQWSRPALLAALSDLRTHGLIEADASGAYQLTRLGRLAGESATEVQSIIRLVDCLRSVRPEEITDPTLITAAQTTKEMDEVLFPINKKSTQKEPQLWPNELRGQGVSRQLLSALHRGTEDNHQATLRAKKAVACLMFVSGEAMNQIEATMTQFGGAFGGAAGPVRAVASRTCDVLPTAARVAEILHSSLDFRDRVARLAIRLTYGIPAATVELARELGAELLRGDYCRLAKAHLCEADAIGSASDEQLLACLDGNRLKLARVRHAGAIIDERRQQATLATRPILAPYEA